MKHKHRDHQFIPLTINNYSIKLGYSHMIIEEKMKHKHRHHQFTLNNQQLQYKNRLCIHNNRSKMKHKHKHHQFCLNNQQLQYKKYDIHT